MSVVSPCPFCGGQKMDWHIPAFSTRVTPFCDDCGAQGPPQYVKDRADRNEATAAALRSWNGRAA